MSSNDERTVVSAPNEREILEYARRRGLVNARLKHSPLFGWKLRGEGRDGRWPLVWEVAEECGISWGCGSTGYHQVLPERFVPPEVHGD